ncbi:MAG: polyprenyl synthetase family protein, partial [Lachnospiraceae bacterium]|nr:polyprenyl synthetase family protein [Lachnospiraceae bacterium]
ASLMIGAILSGAADKDIEVIEEAASKIGIAFQIRDDILDVEGSFEELGKPIGSDEENEKATYVTLFGLDRAKKDVEEYSKRALEILNSFDRKNEFLMELVNSLIARNR